MAQDGRNDLRTMVEEQTPVNLFLMNGFKMACIITFEGKDFFLVKEPKKVRESLVFKHVVSTVQQDLRQQKRNLKYVTEGAQYLANIQKNISVRIFILNGFQFSGKILKEESDYFLVEDGYGKSIVFKRCISTITIEE